MNISLDGNDDSIENFEEGSVLFKEGDLPDKFYIVISGKVACLKKDKERLIPIYTASEKEIVGEDCVLTDSNEYFYSAVALTDCEVIRIEKSDVYKYLNSQGDWIKNILKNISSKIEHTSDLIAEHRILDAKLLADEDFSDEREAKFKSLL